MAWFGESFGDGLSSLKGQITKITKDVLSEDPLAVKSYEGRIKELEDEVRLLQANSCNCEVLRSQLDKLKEENHGLQNAIEGLDSEHEKAMQIIIDERDRLRKDLSEVTSSTIGQGKYVRQNEELIKFQLDVAVKEKEISAALQKYAKLQQEFSSVSAELASAREIMNDFNDRLETSENEAKILYEQLQSKEEEARMLEVNISDLSKEKQRANEIELQLEHAESLIQGLIGEAEKLSETQIAFESLAFENKQLQDRVVNLETAASIKIDENRDVGDTAAMERNLKALETTLEEKINENDSLKEQLTKEISVKNELCHEIQQINIDLAERESKNLQLNEDLALLKITLEKNQQKLANYENEVDQLQCRIFEFEELCTEKETSLQEALCQMKIQENVACKELNTTVSKKQQEITSLNKELEDAALRIRDLDCFNRKQEELVQAMQDAINDTHARLAKEIALKDEYFEKYNTTKVEDNHLNTQNDSICQEKDAIINQLEAELQIKTTQLQECQVKEQDARNKTNEVMQDLESMKIKYDVVKHNFVSTEAEKKQLVQQIASINAQHETLDAEMKQENTELKIELGERKAELQHTMRENKELRDKLDKLGFGVLAGDFVLQFKKLQQLASRVNPTTQQPSGGDDGCDASHQQSQTDDVKHLQQDLANMTTNIGLIENGLNSLESNVSQWAAAVESRDQLIHTQQSRISELEESTTNLENRSEELMKQIDEWERRLRELQALYESEVERLETLCGEKNAQIEHLVNRDGSNQPDSQDQVKRLVDENSDLKELVQKLRSNMLHLNSQLTAQLTPAPSPTLPNPSATITDSKYYALKEKEASLSKEVERLRAHLEEVEEHYTAEAVSNEAELTELRAKLVTAEEQLRSSTTVYKSANVRATQHVDALNAQLQLITIQRNDLQAKLSVAEDQAQKQAAALTSLQVVLEQFQLDKQRELVAADERHKYMCELERRQVLEITDELINVKKQLSEANNGLMAGVRLGEQLEQRAQQLADKEQEISEMRQHLLLAQQEVASLNQATNCKIDKNLVKNLLIGYLATQGEPKAQALRILTAVLDFNTEEKSRAGTQSGEGGWLSNILHPSPTNNKVSSESISQAFVRFLESESRPQQQLRLLPEEKPGSGREATKRSPLVLSELVLPSVTPTPVSETVLKGVFNDS